jgi:sialic acid synthase SpsE
MIRETEDALVCNQKQVFPAELAAAKKLRKSIVATGPLRAGRVLGNGDLTVKSPGTGISPLHWDAIVGKKLLVDMDKDQMLDWEMMGD